MKKRIIHLLLLAVMTVGIALALGSCSCTHEEEIIPAVAATCTETGKTEGKRCRLCGKITVAQTATPYIGHNYVSVNEKAPTCTEDGAKGGVSCSVCGDVQFGFATVPALGHQPTEILAVEPTCTEGGISYGYACSVCGETVFGAEVLPPNGHKLVEHAEIAPTCTEFGTAAGKSCTVCDYKEGFGPLNPLGHTEITVKEVAPDCATDGHKAGKMCSVCNTAIEGCEVIPKLGHKHGDVVILEKSKPGVPGRGTSFCTVCNRTVEIELQPLPGGSWDYDGDDTGVTMLGTTSGVKTELKEEDGRSFVTYSYDEAQSGEWYLFFYGTDLGYLDENTRYVFTTDMKLNYIVPTPEYAAGSSPWFMYTGICDSTKAGDTDHLLSVWKYWKLSSSNHLLTLTNKSSSYTLPYNQWFEFKIVTYLTGEKDKSGKSIVAVDFYVNGKLLTATTLTNKLNESVKAFQLKFKNRSNFNAFSISLDNTTFYPIA